MIETLVYETGQGKNLRDILMLSGIKTVFKAMPETIRKLSEMETSPGIIGLVTIPEPENAPGENPDFKRLLALDGISDPNNLGAIIRTASWYGWDGIICGEKTVEILNGKVIRASMGAVFHQPVWENVNLVEILPGLKLSGYTIYGCVPRGGKFPDKPADRSVLIIGSETRGLSEETEKTCDHLLTIPGSGKAESLNAAVSAGISMDRFSRMTE